MSIKLNEPSEEDDDDYFDRYRLRTLAVFQNITKALGLEYYVGDNDPQDYERRIIEAIESLIFRAERSPDDIKAMEIIRRAAAILEKDQENVV